jgi:hypothetical protein
MRLNSVFIIFLLIVAMCCTPKSNEPNAESLEIAETENAFEPEDLQGEWHMITEIDGEWVLFYPCDADNTFIQIKGDSIIIGWGQDATGGKIENWTADGDKLTLAVNDSYAVSTYPVSAGPDYTEWWLWEDAEKPSRFINAINKSQYKEVRQPCKECWEDCEEELSVD